MRDIAIMPQFEDGFQVLATIKPCERHLYDNARDGVAEMVASGEPILLTYSQRFGYFLFPGERFLAETAWLDFIDHQIYTLAITGEQRRFVNGEQLLRLVSDTDKEWYYHPSNDPSDVTRSCETEKACTR